MATKKRTRRRRSSSAASIDLTASGKVGMQMQGERLTVKLSRSAHPEIFDIEKLIKDLAKTRESYKGKRKMRDFCELLAETEKSLEIVLSNHLEDALRKYLK